MLPEIPPDNFPVEEEEESDIGFIPSAMAYVAMPHSEQKGVAVFKRTNGRSTFSILNDPDIGLPFGKIPRLMVAFICSRAKKTGERVIDIGSNQSQFMRMLGMGNSGGSNGAIHRVRDQAHRLFMSNITITSNFTDESGDAEGFSWNKLSITDEGMSLWNPHAPQREKWVGQITLTEKFFKECIEHAIPVSMQTLHDLRSPLAMDVYVWMTYRYNTLERLTNISWRQMQMQIGSGYPQTTRGSLDFKQNFKKQIAAVSELYPSAKFKINDNGILLIPSPTHIAML